MRAEQVIERLISLTKSKDLIWHGFGKNYSTERNGYAINLEQQRHFDPREDEEVTVFFVEMNEVRTNLTATQYGKLVGEIISAESKDRNAKLSQVLA